MGWLGLDTSNTNMQLCTEHVDLMHGVCGHLILPPSATPSAIAALTGDGKDASSLQLMARPPRHQGAWPPVDWIALSRRYAD